MLKIFICVGIPSSGKSFWAKQEIAKDPDNWVRINNDDIRAMMNNSVYSPAYEKFITDTRNYLIRESLKRDKNVIVDNVNLNKRHFEEVCRIAKSMNKDIQVIEKQFYIELEDAIERDSNRVGTAQVGEKVIRDFWKKSGGKQFKFYKPKVETFVRKTDFTSEIKPLDYDTSLPFAIICDLDGTLSLFNKIDKDGSVIIQYKDAQCRNPYDASKAEYDMVNKPLADILLSFFHEGYHIVFCSGRQESHREYTEKFINKNLGSRCEFNYDLFMRQTGDNRKDDVVKEEIYWKDIATKYNIYAVFDDRLSVCEMWHKLGLSLFRFGDPNDNF